MKKGVAADAFSRNCTKNRSIHSSKSWIEQRTPRADPTAASIRRRIDCRKNLSPRLPRDRICPPLAGLYYIPRTQEVSPRILVRPYLSFIVRHTRSNGPKEKEMNRARVTVLLARTRSESSIGSFRRENAPFVPFFTSSLSLTSLRIFSNDRFHLAHLHFIRTATAYSIPSTRRNHP